MELIEAQDRLKLARIKQKELRVEIDSLRDLIWDLGVDPDDRHPDLPKRNKEIYRLYKRGKKFSEIAVQYKLSGTTVRNICRRIERGIARRKEKGKQK